MLPSSFYLFFSRLEGFSPGAPQKCSDGHLGAKSCIAARLATRLPRGRSTGGDQAGRQASRQAVARANQAATNSRISGLTGLAACSTLLTIFRAQTLYKDICQDTGEMCGSLLAKVYLLFF